MEYTGGIAIRRKYLQKGSKLPQLKLTENNSVLIFPFSLTMGFITSTENGIRQNDSVNVFNYSTFQRIFTGLENVLAQWDGAYKVEKVNDDDNFLTKTYQVGNSFKAYVPKENLGATFEASAISGDFLAEFTQETFTIHTYEDVQEADLFKLFIIPTLKENKWLYITGADKYFLPNGKLHHVEITLESLNNRIAKSGKAIEEFVQRSAPGEGYAFPVVDGHNVTLDTVRIKDVPITSIQIEGAGALAMGTIYAHGRPTIQKTENGKTVNIFNPKIEAPRLLLPLRLETAIPSPINTRPSAETDWLIGRFKPTLAEDFKDWKDEIQANYDLTQRSQYEGVLKSIENDSEVNSSNPVVNETRNHLLWDENFTFNVEKIYNTSTDAFTKDTLNIKKSITIQELLAHNIFGLSAFTTLPLSVEQNVAWSLRDIPIIGGFLSKLTFGIPIGWTNTAIKVKMSDIVLAIPASLRNYANVLIKSEADKLRIDLNTFTDEVAKNDAIDLAGIKATGSIWKTQLTDRFYKTIGNVIYNFGTVDLAQTGAIGKPKTITNPITPDIKIAGKLLWDATCQPAPRNADTPGFVIDTSTFKALAKMDVRTAFFSNNISVWEGTYQTTSKFTNSIRDWTNATKYSNWKEDNNLQIDYPDIINSPNPPNINNPLFEIKQFNLVNTYEQISKDLMNKLTFITYGIFDTRLNNGTSKITVKGTLDTTANGGINGFNDNYKEIEISDIIDGVNDNIKINVQSLINQGSIILKENTKNTDYKISWINNNGQGGNLEAFITVKEIIKLSVTGDIIELELIQEYTCEWKPNPAIIQGNITYEQPKPNVFKEIKTTNAIATPKTI